MLYSLKNMPRGPLYYIDTIHTFILFAVKTDVI